MAKYLKLGLMKTLFFSNLDRILQPTRQDERENKRFEEQKQWDMRKTKSKADYKRAMEFFLLAKRRARMGGKNRA
jgi:hypothetical protein